MKVHSNYEGCTVPTAFVTKGRQRVKQYADNTIYLNDRDEFEIELFNPTTNKILAKIELNGKSIGAGIVLRPGERVFLERYLDEAKKFLFETYVVDKDNGDVMRAIKDNGRIEVFFHSETRFYNINLTGECYSWTTTVWPPQPSQPFTYTTSDTAQVRDIPQGSISYGSGNNYNCFYSNTKSISHNAPQATSNSFWNKLENKLSANIETGRIERGSNSNQGFTYDNTSFQSWWSWKSEWKILPFSQKPVENRDIKVYCTKCGAKRKKQSHQFCPNCGTKY